MWLAICLPLGSSELVLFALHLQPLFSYENVIILTCESSHLPSGSAPTSGKESERAAVWVFDCWLGSAQCQEPVPCLKSLLFITSAATACLLFLSLGPSTADTEWQPWHYLKHFGYISYLTLNVKVTSKSFRNLLLPLFLSFLFA